MNSLFESLFKYDLSTSHYFIMQKASRIKRNLLMVRIEIKIGDCVEIFELDEQEKFKCSNDERIRKVENLKEARKLKNQTLMNPTESVTDTENEEMIVFPSESTNMYLNDSLYIDEEEYNLIDYFSNERENEFANFYI